MRFMKIFGDGMMLLCCAMMILLGLETHDYTASAVSLGAFIWLIKQPWVNE